MGFLNKARKMMGGNGTAEPPRPQYYQVSCAEGHVIRGERTEGYQALRCPHCGDGIFVLPRSPLPLPPVPASSKAKSRPARIAASEFEDEAIRFTAAPPQEELEEIQWADVEEAVAPVPRPVASAPARPQKKPVAPATPDLDEIPWEDDVVIPPRAAAKPSKIATASPLKPRALPTPKPTPETADAAELQSGRISVSDRKKSSRRVLLVLSCVAFISVGAIYYRSYKNRLQELPHEAEINALEGKLSLETGHFDEAKIKLNRAAKAYKQFGAIDDPLAVEAIQLADEAAIFADLGRRDLKEIVEEIAGMNEAEGLARFKAFYQGKSILVQDSIESVKNGQVELHSRILVGRGPAPSKQGRLDLTNFALFKDKDFKKDESLIFGARLDMIRLEGDVWRITLQPESGVWITNEKAKAIALPESTE